jgi:hypothetical protein
MINADVSKLYNFEYTELSQQTCGELSKESRFCRPTEDSIVSDRAGLDLEWDNELPGKQAIT